MQLLIEMLILRVLVASSLSRLFLFSSNIVIAECWKGILAGKAGIWNVQSAKHAPVLGGMGEGEIGPGDHTNIS